jgi:hypothetical protein
MTSIRMIPSLSGNPDCDYALVDDRNFVIGEAVARMGEWPRIDAKANATLWAAAPELLAACEAFLEAYQDAAREYHFGQMLDSAFCDVLEPVHDAVRKAKGEQ